MNKWLNEKGSLPLILAVILVITMSVASLVTTMISEKITMSRSASTDVQHSYEKDSVIEAVKNATLQRIKSKSWKSVENQKIFESGDWEAIEVAVNNEILPAFQIQGTVDLQATLLPLDLNAYCEEGEGGRLTCSGAPFEMGGVLNITHKGQVTGFGMTWDEIVPTVDDSSNAIYLDTENVEHRLND